MRVRRSSPPALVRRGVALTVAAGVLTLRPVGLPAQGASEIRVFETVQPETGRRSLHVLEGLSPEEIRAVQGALRRAGFDAPWQEGALDPFTRGALQGFQTRRGLTVCACVSLETLIELGLRTRVAETIVLEPASSASERPEDELPPEAAADEGPPAPYIDYGRYYPFGVIYLTPVIPVHRARARGLAVTHAGSPLQGFVGVQAGGLQVGAVLGGAPSVRPPLVPFGRVPMPPNVVRGGR